MPSTAHLMVSLFICSSKSFARGKSRAVAAQKALQWSETETRELLGGTEREQYFPGEGFIDFPLQVNQ